MTDAPECFQPDIVERMKGYIHGEHDEYIPEVLQLACDEIERLRGAAQGARVPKVRTSHHRNKEEAARLQELVAKRYAPAQAVPEPVAWRLTDGEGDYEYLTVEPSDQSRAWSRRYGREWEPLYASPVSSTHHGDAT